MAENGEKLKRIAIEEVGVAQNEGRRALDFGGGEQSQSQSQSRQRSDVTGEKRTARKSSFRICKPQGTFLWPSSTGTDMSGSGGGSSGISMEHQHQLPRSSLTMGRAPAVEVVMADEQAMLGAGDYFSTPPSASSTTNAGKLLALPSPRSPLQPQPLFTAGFTVPALHPFAGLTLRHMVSTRDHLLFISQQNQGSKLTDRSMHRMFGWLYARRIRRRRPAVLV